MQLFDISDRTELALVGPDSRAFLNRLATNRTDPLPSGTGCETFLTDAKGRVRAYLRVLASDDGLLLDSAPGQAAAIAAHLSRYLLRDRVEIRDTAPPRRLFLLTGAEAEALLSPRTGPLPRDLLAHRPVELEGTRIGLCRLDVESHVAWRLSCPADDGDVVLGALRDMGAALGDRSAAEAWRIAAGWPEYGRDIAEDNLPQEIARDSRAICFDKGCYLGQETVARIESRGHVNQTLVRLHFPSPPPPATELLAEGKPVGRVTSSASLPDGQGIALGYVRRGWNQPGTVFASAVGAAEIV